MSSPEKLFNAELNGGRIEVVDKRKESLCGIIQYNNNGSKTFLLNVRKKPKALQLAIHVQITEAELANNPYFKASILGKEIFVIPSPTPIYLPNHIVNFHTQDIFFSSSTWINVELYTSQGNLVQQNNNVRVFLKFDVSY